MLIGCGWGRVRQIPSSSGRRGDRLYCSINSEAVGEGRAMRVWESASCVPRPSWVLPALLAWGHCTQTQVEGIGVPRSLRLVNTPHVCPSLPPCAAPGLVLILLAWDGEGGPPVGPPRSPCRGVRGWERMVGYQAHCSCGWCPLLPGAWKPPMSVPWTPASVDLARVGCFAGWVWLGDLGTGGCFWGPCEGGMHALMNGRGKAGGWRGW